MTLSSHPSLANQRAKRSITRAFPPIHPPRPPLRQPLTYQLPEDAVEKAPERAKLTFRLTEPIRAVTAIAPAPIAVSDEYAKERREDFQMRVLSGKFNDLTADYGILALFICPEAPIPRLDLPKIRSAQAAEIMPLDGNGGGPQFAGRSLLTKDRYREGQPFHAVTGQIKGVRMIFQSRFPPFPARAHANTPPIAATTILLASEPPFPCRHRHPGLQIWANLISICGSFSPRLHFDIECSIIPYGCRSRHP